MFHDAVGPTYERVSYDMFNLRLLGFLKSMQAQGKAVWISPINQYFVDMLSIHLVVVNPKRPSRFEQWAYYGAKDGFCRYKPSNEFTGCISGIQAQYPPLALVRECRSALETLRLGVRLC
jgi:hypothetical protein